MLETNYGSLRIIIGTDNGLVRGTRQRTPTYGKRQKLMGTILTYYVSRCYFWCIEVCRSSLPEIKLLPSFLGGVARSYPSGKKQS